MALFAAKKPNENDPDAKANPSNGRKRAIFIIGAPESDYGAVTTSTRLMGVAEFEKIFELEKLNYDILRTLKLDPTSANLMPENWEKNDLLGAIKDEVKQLATASFEENNTLLISSSNLCRTASLWAKIFDEAGISPSFIICFAKPQDNFLNWLVYNLEAEKNSRGFTRSFVHLPDFLNNWRKALRRTSSELDVELSNWLSTTREMEVDDLISSKNIAVLPKEKRQNAMNVRRLYSALLDASNGKKYDVSVSEELLPDIRLFFAPLMQKNAEIAELKTRLSKIEDEVIDLRDRILQPDDDLYEQALEDGTMDKARLEGEKIYLQSWRGWAAERKATQDFAQYPLFSMNAPLADEVIDIATTLPSTQLAILDVMSPPITSVGTQMEGRKLHVIPTSPYANEFNLALQQAGIKPPVPVIKVAPENLLQFFGKGSIDIVHCREAIEYTKNPVVVLTQMLAVMKDDGAIFLSHQINKASEENYNTLAQWNCVEKSGQFIIWNSWYKFNISRMLAGVYEVEAKSYIDFVEVVIRKKTTA